MIRRDCAEKRRDFGIERIETEPISGRLLEQPAPDLVKRLLVAIYSLFTKLREYSIEILLGFEVDRSIDTML